MTRTLRSTLFALGLFGLGATTAISASAVAEPGAAGAGFRGRGGHHERLEQLVADLNLTEAQQEQLDGIREDMRARHREGREDRLDNLAAMQKFVKNPAKNREAIHDLVDARIEARRESMHATADQLIDFAETLTPEQRATLADRFAQLEARLERFRGGRDE